MKYVIAMVLAGLPMASAADGFLRVLNDEAIVEALAGKTLIYDAHTMQHFGAGGDTQYITERMSEGRWAARGGQYCSVWPPADVWTCYDLQIGGDVVRFIGSDRTVSEGTYRK